MQRYRKGNTFGTRRVTLARASDYKAKRHRLRTIVNPYTSQDATILRGNVDVLEEAWRGTEERKGHRDRKEVVT
jgi:hypothetical protein